MRFFAFRDSDGYLMSKSHPKCGKVRKPKYVFCPQTNGLMYFQKCKDCEMCKEMTKKGVICMSTSPNEAPEYYNR